MQVPAQEQDRPLQVIISEEMMRDVDFVAVGTLDTVIPRLTSAGSKNPNFRRRLRDHVRKGDEARNVAA